MSFLAHADIERPNNWARNKIAGETGLPRRLCDIATNGMLQAVVRFQQWVLILMTGRGDVLQDTSVLYELSNRYALLMQAL